MGSMPSGGDVLTENGSLLWMQWMDRENYTIVLCDSVASTISGPWSIDNVEVTPCDPIMLLKKEALFIECMKNK